MYFKTQFQFDKSCIRVLERRKFEKTFSSSRYRNGNYIFLNRKCPFSEDDLLIAIKYVSKLEGSF
jgi:hypothetical protein